MNENIRSYFGEEFEQVYVEDFEQGFSEALFDAVTAKAMTAAGASRLSNMTEDEFLDKLAVYSESQQTSRQPIVADGEVIEDAIQKAIDHIIEEGVGLSEFFQKHRDEIAEVTRKEYTEEAARQVAREEANAKGRTTAFFDAVAANAMTSADAARLSNMTEEEFLEKLAAHQSA